MGVLHVFYTEQMVANGTNGTNGAILNKWYHHIDMALYLPHTVIAIKLTIKNR